MKLLNYETNGTINAGVIEKGRILRLRRAYTVERLISFSQPKGLQLSAEGLTPEVPDGVKIRPPILAPDKILLAAVNYKAHGAEQKSPPPLEPYFFTKFKSCIIGDGDPIVIPRVSSRADWEAELAVVIGRRCKYVSKAEALSYVAGYTVANDVSFRWGGRRRRTP